MLYYSLLISGLFELNTRGGRLNHKVKLSGLRVCLECRILINHDRTIYYKQGGSLR